jgi:hypothetical protein
MIEASGTPRLPDGDYLELRIDEPGPEQAWQYALGWLPLGWYMAPPRLEESGGWCVVAYNVRGWLQAPSYVIGRADTITWALLNVGWDLEPCSDEDCTRDKYRKRN